MKSQKLKGKAISGIFWNFVQLGVNKFFGFAIKLVLAKLLFPEQFGLVGMAVVFTSFIQVFNDLGIGAALVQRKEENLREAHYHTAFWTGVVWSIGIYLIIAFIVSPLAAIFYKEPMLRSIIPVLSIGVLSSPVNLVHRAQLTKWMDFKKLAFISNASTVFSGVLALSLAFLGAGVWALVFNSVATFLVAMPLYFRATKWTPKLIWEKQAFQDVFGFGVYTTGTNFINTLVSNIDYLLIGKLLSAAALGAYTLAFVFTDTFRDQFTYLINKVMYPIYGQKQDDLISLRSYYLKVVKYNSIAIYPMMVFLIVLGEPFIMYIYGAKWVDSILPLRILALSVMIHLLANSHLTLIRGLGHAKLGMRVQLIKSVLYVPTITLGIYQFGIVGAAWAYVFNKVLEVFIAQYFLKRLVNVSFVDLFTSMKAPLTATAVSLLITSLLYDIGLHYILCAIVLSLSYVAVIWLMMKTEIMMQIHEFRESRKKKVALL
ncbi:lipopolysaccharide biosynthesis protein [Pontibacter sp. 172403-2]|uniref:lipopolysaccharide biosynthesis protein n=1 Tax=Pontibacter rufus TaxID=2791028 RepID=UPI0018AFABB2|nr:lipopolysaccharide biosynthesis protein [Pontibacter sp. 172403-2]MBF9252535.1 lipopolysaccharide biosynthesis protein [Pontibacter sp. 172403-2]